MSVPAPIMIVGGGRMGEAVVSGVLAARLAAPDSILVAEPDGARREEIASSLGVGVVASALEGVGTARLVVLAVKPQVIDEVVRELSPALDAPYPLVISVAAGVGCSRLEEILPEGTRVVRVMPNAPAMVGCGISALSGGAMADQEALDVTGEVFSALGKVVVVEEELQDAVTGVSGSGPAYVALFVQALAGAGVANGLSAEVAYMLALQTVAGTAELLLRSAQTPAELVETVSSPGGTTVAARDELGRGGFEELIGRAVDAAVRRSKELGRG